MLQHVAIDDHEAGPDGVRVEIAMAVRAPACAMGSRRCAGEREIHSPMLIDHRRDATNCGERRGRAILFLPGAEGGWQVTGGRILTGSCLCGQICFAVSGALGEALNCHCSICRKAHAAAFRSRVSVAAEQFAWTAGAGEILWYESSPGTYRGFCGKCGTRLISRMDAAPETLGVPLALFDDDPGVRPACHVHVASKAPWFEIADDLPQFR